MGPSHLSASRMGILTLARCSGSTLIDLPRLYLDPSFRDLVLRDLDDPIGLAPDWRWFMGLPARDKSVVTAPSMNKARQFVARPSIRIIVGQAKPAISMRQIIDQRKVLLVYLPKGLIGSETATLLGCLVLIFAVAGRDGACSPADWPAPRLRTVRR